MRGSPKKAATASIGSTVAGVYTGPGPRLRRTLPRVRPGAELVERVRQLCGDGVGVAVLDVAPLEHVDERPVAEEHNRRRRGRIAGEVAAGTHGRFDVRAGEHRRHPVGRVRVTQGQRDAWT